MVISIGRNIPSLRALRQLDGTSRELSSVFERLSSGQRINQASDDAAGLAIASSLDSDHRVFSQGVRNLNDGISLLNIAQGALEGVNTILIRIHELAEQAANGTYSHTQRAALERETQALAAEYRRTLESAAFNGSSVLDTSSPVTTLQAGYGVEGLLQVSLGSSIFTSEPLGTFSGQQSYRAGFVSGGSAVSLVEAVDVNQDGFADILNGSFTDSTLTVLLSNGDGSFRGPTQFGGFSPFSGMAVADFTGDGFVDVMRSSNYLTNAVTLFVGNGNGSFQSEVTIGTAANYENLNAPSDLNNDGKVDLVLRSPTGSIDIMLGNGNGIFSAAVSYATGLSLDLYLANVNGDGRSDILSHNGNSAMSILLANSNGTFAAAISFSVQSDGIYRAHRAGDINGDGVTDFLVASGNKGYTYLGNGDGSFRFGEEMLLTTYMDPYAVALEDLDDDGFGDMAFADSFFSTINIAFGNGDGSFSSATSYDGFGSAPKLLLADFNQDGANDLVGWNYPSDCMVQILLGDVHHSLELPEISVGTRDEALAALSTTSTQLDRVRQELGRIGTFQNRLGVALSTLQVGAEQFKAAESRIRDTDLARDSALLVRTRILQQAGSAVLAQANQQPRIALSLLQNAGP